jgi:hypothetical protein
MPTRRSRCIAVVLAVTGGVAGCSLAFHPSDYDGPASGDDGGLDVSTLADVPPSADGPSAADSGTTDAPPVIDAEAGAALPFCTGVDAAFCADFDEDVLQLGWTLPIHNSSAGTLALDTAIAQSKPGSEHATLPMATTPDGGVYDEEFLQKNLLTPWREATLDFDVYIAAHTGNGIVIVSFVFVGNESVGAAIAYGVSENTLQLGGMQTSDASQWFYGSSPYVPSTWTHIQLDVLPATSGGMISISIGGALVEQWPADFSADPNAQELQLQLGLSRYGNYTNAVDVRYDNVVIRLL